MRDYNSTDYLFKDERYIMIFNYNRIKKQSTKLKELDDYLKSNNLRLNNYITWLCKSKDLSEQIIKHAVMQVKKEIQSGKEINNVKINLHKALKNQCDENFSYTSLGQLQSDILEKNSNNPFQVALRKVPERYSQALIMQIIARFSVSEIADTLEITNIDAASRLLTARIMMSNLMQTENPNSPSAQAIEMTKIPASHLTDLQSNMGIQAQISL